MYGCIISAKSQLATSVLYVYGKAITFHSSCQTNNNNAWVQFVLLFSLLELPPNKCLNCILLWSFKAFKLNLAKKYMRLLSICLAFAQHLLSLLSIFSVFAQHLLSICSAFAQNLLNIDHAIILKHRYIISWKSLLLCDFSLRLSIRGLPTNTKLSTSLFNSIDSINFFDTHFQTPQLNIFLIMSRW